MRPRNPSLLGAPFTEREAEVAELLAERDWALVKETFYTDAGEPFEVFSIMRSQMVDGQIIGHMQSIPSDFLWLEPHLELAERKWQRLLQDHSQ